MQTLTAVVLGSTGLVGEQLVQQLLNDVAFSKVRILVRRPVELSHPKLEVVVVDFDNMADYKKKFGRGDCIFCCIGTTNKKVKGDKDAYRKIDFDIPIDAANIGKDLGFTDYLLVSAVGANAGSSNFYLRLKGEVEKEIGAAGFASFHAFRPSMLFGKRREFRLAEIIGKPVMKGLSVLLVSRLKKFRGIDGSVVANAMVAAAKSGKRGFFVHHFKDMVEAGGRF